MNTRTVTQSIAVVSVIAAVILALRIQSNRLESVPARQVSNAVESERGSTHRDSEPDRSIKVSRDSPSAQKARKPPEPPIPQVTDHQRPRVENESATPDEEFLQRVASLPLDRATLEARLEVGRRIKSSEKDRAKLIFSEEGERSTTFAYAIKQASMDEINQMTKPYKLLLGIQDSYSARKYIEERESNLFRAYGLTEGAYRLHYCIIPKSAQGSPVRSYSYAAASEEECLQILKEELAPRPPVVMGVPYTGSARERKSSSAYGITPGDWRLDHLVPENLLSPFYQGHYRAELLRTQNSSSQK